MRLFFKKLFYLLERKDKNKFILLIVFSLFISLIETIGISIIMPFMQVATDISVIDSNKYYSYIYNIFNFENSNSFIILFGISLIIFYFLRSFINYTYFYRLAKYAQDQYHLVASKLFKKYLKMPYRYFIKSNSSVLSKSIITEAQLLTTVIIALLMILSEIFIVILIYMVMIMVDFNITIFLTLLLGVNAFFMIKIISPKIKQAGVDRANHQESFYEILNKSFGNYKMIKLHTFEEKIHSEFVDGSFGFVKSNIQNQTLSNFPRLFLEAVSFSIIISIVIYLVGFNSSETTVPILAKVSIFLLALYRLMPSINRIMTAYNQILFNHKALDIIYKNMHYPNEKLGHEAISFKSSLRLENIEFEYIENIKSLESINLTINKNEKIAIVGESGSGKSTLVDLVIGLHQPSKGNIIIDGKVLNDTNLASWRDKIGYIPQMPYLFDGTVGENISFGSKYDKEKIDKVLKLAQLYDIFLEKEGDRTKIGENGIALSGGQRQRIAIARALYKDPQILVLDEATSALDYDTEIKIMEEIYDIAKNKTLIIIAHRLSTIQGCDKIVELKDGQIVNIDVKREI